MQWEMESEMCALFLLLVQRLLHLIVPVLMVLHSRLLNRYPMQPRSVGMTLQFQAPTRYPMQRLIEIVALCLHWLLCLHFAFVGFGQSAHH
jgi:hypothetical protein